MLLFVFLSMKSVVDVYSTIKVSLIPGPSLHGRRTWYTPNVHAPVCTQNLVTLYIPVKYSVNYQYYDNTISYTARKTEVSKTFLAWTLNSFQAVSSLEVN